MDTIHITANSDALRSRAVQLIEAGRMGAARPILAAAQALAPDSPDLALLGARLALSTGAWDEANQQLDSAITAAPSDGALRKCRVEVRQRLGDREGAARDAAEAVICDRQDMQAKAMLGVTMLDLGRDLDGVACLTEAVAGAPEEMGYRIALATALEKLDHQEEALRVLMDGMEQCPDNISIRNAAIVLCIRRRDFHQAVRLAETARVLGIADANTFGMTGHALCSLGDHEQATAAYQEALKLSPEDPYVRHLVASSTAMPGARRAPDGYIRTVFDDYADRFENHVITLQYGIPDAIRDILLSHPRIASGLSLGQALDLGCGTGLVALAIGDLPIASITGVDLSPRMLAHARAKRLYATLHESEIVSYLSTHDQRWSLIIAADVLIYFGGLEDMLNAAYQRLEPNGWFIFSVEQILPDHDGVVPGNGNWALQRQGRFAHAEHYVYEAVCAAGFRILRMDRPVIRQEAGTNVPGLLFTAERVGHDD